MFDDWDERERSAEEDWRGGDDPPDLRFGDPDAWRGGVPEDAEGWRGTTHLTEWPVWNAGPEYHMWKRRVEGE